MTQTGRIYSITCKVNGKRYIGQTIKNVAERWKNHLQESNAKEHRPLYRAIKKYGQGMFVVRIIEDDIPINKLSEREVYWIEQFDTYNNGFNLTTGGEESKAIHQDVKDKISTTMQGVVKSDEHVSQMRETLRERYKNKPCFEKNGNGKHHLCKVRGTHTTTGEVVEFNSLKEACEKLSLKNGNLSRGIKKGYTVGGYKWEKLEDKTVNYRIYGKRILDGKIIHHFNSVREAGRVLGTGSDSGVAKALKNPSRYSWKGCRWYREK